MITIKRALISCTDKTGIVEFAQFLASQNVEILSTGGTAKTLRDASIAVKDVAEFTGSPEILDGRVKTLHPKVHGGLLGIRKNPEHQKQMADNAIQPIDLVVVNLYAFEKTIAKDGVTLADAIENIDIGGPAMLRSAAKNHGDVVVVTDPADYARVTDQIKTHGGVSNELAFVLAVKVFETTSQYDAAITTYLKKQLARSCATNPPACGTPLNKGGWGDLPKEISFNITKIQDLRYGENPHQAAGFYRDTTQPLQGLAAATQLQGKELSYNNILDSEAALACCRDFTAPTCVIVKHNNPCGVASEVSLQRAFENAKACDPVSAFGGIVAFNRVLDVDTAKLVAETFFEVILAPDFSADALKVFATKKNLRLLKMTDMPLPACDTLELRCVSGGVLVQNKDNKATDLSSCPAMTERKPSHEEIISMDFAWKVAKHVKSNAIVFAKGTQTIGIGAGQMSRIDSTRIAAMKASENFKDANILKGTALASDAFFPFRDGLDAAAKYGITAVAQPGGSMRDNEVIAAANEHGIAMVFTGTRHFRH